MATAKDNKSDTASEGKNKALGLALETIEKQFKVKIDRKKVELTEPIKHVGEYPVKIKIYPSIQAEIKVTVTATD